MPSYPLVLPTSPIPQRVVVRNRSVVARFENTYTLQHQVQQTSPNRRWEVEITLQKMDATDAAAWTQFFYDLAGGVGTFAMNLTPYCPGLSPAPGWRVFRLASNDVNWTSDFGMTYEFTFAAVESIGDTYTPP